MYIFTDSSVSPPHNIGIGAYLIVDNLYEIFIDKTKLQHVQFQTRKSTEAELLTAKYVLDQLGPEHENLEICMYTDCKRFYDLVNKRKPIKNTHKHSQLYKDLINLVDKYKAKVIWTNGHLKGELKVENHQYIFAYVDIHARDVLRDIVKEQ
jgi:hypothetical protein